MHSKSHKRLDIEYEEMTTVEVSSIESLNITKARCAKYIPKIDKETKSEICSCGRLLSDHNTIVRQRFQREGIISDEKWSADIHTADDGPTDAFGEIRFINNSDNVSKYIRVNHKTDISKVIQLLFNYWKLKEPKLLISVTGGAKKFTLKPRLKDVFRRGLVKAAVSTGAWISTGGFNVGVMKHVGEAVRENITTLNPNQKIVVLGIAVWTMISNNDKLIINNNNINNAPIEYTLVNNEEKQEKQKKQPLDPNHSHFILVDGAQMNYGGEIDFRARLESEISKRKLDDGKSAIPIVVLVLEGGPGTLKTVFESVKNNSPCVFVEGSGKCADIFAYALKRLSEQDKEGVFKIDRKLEKEIKAKIFVEWPELDLDSTYNQIAETLDPKYRDLLSVFTLDSDEQAFDIDIAILTSLLKAKKENYLAQLKLSLSWDRVDIARDYIFSQDIKWKPEQLDGVMYYAILNDRVDFVNLLLANGFNLKIFLTNRCLLKLYNDAFTSGKNKLTLIYLSLLKNKRIARVNNNARNARISIDFKDIGRIIQVLVEDIYEPHFTKEPYNELDLGHFFSVTDDIGKVRSEKKRELISVTQNMYGDLELDARCNNPEHELFLFSILLLRTDMAKVFWREGSNEIFLALLSTKILKTLVSFGGQETYALNEIANEFEDMAISVLNNCYNTDEEKAEFLLIREIPYFGNLTSLQVAVSANDLKLVAHPCTQSLLTKLWYNKIMPDTWKPTIGIAILIPVLAPFIIEYREDRRLKYKPTKQFNSNSKSDEAENGGIVSSAANLLPTNEIAFMDSGRHLSYFDKFYYFVKAPLIKFLYSQISYILFLMLFSYIMLCDFFPIKSELSPTNVGLEISVPEIVLIIWVIMLSIDGIRQFCETDAKLLRARFRLYFSNFWNTIEAIAIILYFIALILRFIPDNQDCYMIARIIFCIDLILWYIKSLNFYSVIRNLGPKLVMINRMMYETMYFIFIVIVFLFAFGVSTQALMYHNQELNSELLKQVFFPAYFVIGGEYYTLDNILQADSCEQINDTQIYDDIYTQDDCPEKSGAKITSALYVTYLIILNILLVNLLIAIFSNTFEQVQNETDNIWKFQRYSLIYEYYHKPIIAAPFSIFSYTISFLRIFLRPLRRKFFPNLKKGEKHLFKRLFLFLSKDWKTGFRANFDKNEEQRLMKWEDIVSDEFLHEEERETRETDSYKIELALNRVESLNRKFDEIIDKRQDLQNQIIKCEEKLDRVLQLLNANFKISSSQLADSNFDDSFKQNSIQFVKPNDSSLLAATNVSLSLHQSVVASTTSINKLTPVENDNINFEKEKAEIINDKSRTPHYPKSNITRVFVPDSKLSWSVEWPEYNPIEFTSKDVINNPNADNNVEAYPAMVRPDISFNALDELHNVDRQSCLGKYKVINGVPLNPMGRTGLKGRGLLSYWGPNHAVQAIFTRWKVDNNGSYLIGNNGKKQLQFLIIEKPINLSQWHLPHVIIDNLTKVDSILMSDLLTQVFPRDTIMKKEFKEKLKTILKKSETIHTYYKDSQRNTDNAWLEASVVNYHDEPDSLFNKLPLKEPKFGISVKWTDLDRNKEYENPHDWPYLKKVAQIRDASLQP